MKPNKNLEPIKTLRSEIAKNIIQRRKLAKELRNYSKYALSKRKLGVIVNNTSFIYEVSNKFQELENEYKKLFKIYLNYATRIKKKKN